MSSSASALPLGSVVCRREHWDTAWFARWAPAFAGAEPEGGAFVPRHIRYHRKTWEWAAIAEALAGRGMLAPGRRGCGFAVGREPLACLFAREGVEVLATDLAAVEQGARDWSAAGQHAASLDALYWPGLIDRAEFDARVRFRPQDMRALDFSGLGSFDFVWSACSFEHLGDLEAGLRFVLASTALLRPGGVAVHTTEFNLSSDEHTIERGDNVVYRRKDIAALAGRLRLLGCAMEPLDDFAGTAPEDIEYDFPPYYGHGREHVKLLIGDVVSTSCLIVVTKGRTPDVLPDLPAYLARTTAHGPAEVAPPPAGLARLRRSALWRATAPLRALLRLLRPRRD
jgi:hypothetical protein